MLGLIEVNSESSNSVCNSAASESSGDFHGWKLVRNVRSSGVAHGSAFSLLEQTQE
jgi:hypothetical protein